MSATNTMWRSLEQRNAAVFVVAGVLYVGFVIVSAITGFTEITSIWLGVAEIGTGFGGLVVSIIGVIGLYPRLNDRVPRLSGAALLAFVLAVVGLAGTVVWLVGIVGLENAPEAVPVALTALASLSILLIAAGFLLFAVACLRTNTPSRRVGYLLFIPVIMWVWHYVALAIFGSTYLGTVIDYTVIAATFLYLGYLLRTNRVPPEHTGRSPREGEPT